MTVHLESGSIDLGLRLLDHQLVSAKGELVGNVDNAVLVEVDGVLTVTGIISGPVGLAGRLKGRPGHWVAAIWLRLRPEQDPHPLVLPMDHVVALGSAVRVSDWGCHVLQADSLLEIWLRRHIISRIPGATGGEDRQAGEPIEAAAGDGGHLELRLRPGSHLLSDLLGATVRTAAGDVAGVVLEVTAEARDRTGLEVGPLRVTSLTYGPHRFGAELGYTAMTDQGPRLIAAALRPWQRRNQRAAITQVEDIDWNDQVLTLLTSDA